MPQAQIKLLSPCLGLGILGLALAVFAWPSLAVLCDIYNKEDDYSHGLMVPFVSGYFAWQIVREKKMELKSSWFGIPLIVIGVLVVTLGQWYLIAIYPDGLGVGFLLAIGLILCLAGTTIAFGGIKFLRLLFFPFIYLVFTVPFPKSFTLSLTLWLRNLVSVFSEEIIRAIGITVFREGNVLHLVNASLGVEDACSGIRSFWMLMAGAAALGYVLNMGFFRSVLLCMLTLPVSVAMNVLRVVATGFLVHRAGIQYASGWRHEVCGWVTFGCGLAALIGLASLLSRKLAVPHSGNDGESPRVGALVRNFLAPQRVSILATVVALFSFGASANFIIHNHYQQTVDDAFSDRKPLAEFPKIVGDFTLAKQRSLLKDHLDLLSPSDYTIVSYQNSAGAKVELRVIYWSPGSRRGKGIKKGVRSHFPDVCYPAWGFERIPDFDLELRNEEVTGQGLSARLFSKAGRRESVVFWYKDVPGKLSNRFAYLLQSWKDPSVNKEGAQYVVTIVTDGSDSPDLARRTLLDFANELGQILPEFGIH